MPRTKKQTEERESRIISSSSSNASNASSPTPSPDPPRRETITLAIDKCVLDDIRKTAKDDGTSVNALINLILIKWVNFFKYHKENQVITLTSQNFESFLEKVDEEILVREFKSNALGVIRAILISRNIPITLDNLIEYEYKTFGVLGGAFQSVTSYKDPERHTCIVFKQQYGEKWSRVIARVFSEQLETLFHCHIDPIVLPNAVILRILETNIGTNVDH